jgi:tetratricopeptide (TPR) repeat protein
MTRKPKNAECVDSLINSLPEKPDSPLEGEQKMLTTLPPNGKDHFFDLQDAFSEKDIIQLRAQLHEIISSGNFRDGNIEAVFDLAEEIKIPHFMEGWENPDLDTFLARKPLPRIHIHHHHRADSENMHRFYVEQFKSGQGLPDIDMGIEQNEEFPDLEEALLENDIMELRETLTQLSRSSSLSHFSVEQIDNYLDGNLTNSELETFEAELDFNSELSRDVELHTEVDEALHETDIINIREKLERIIESQHSTTWNVEEVDAFINGEMPENELDAFIVELVENDDLKAEVNLSKNLDRAFAEKDIHHLRKELELIAKEIDQQSTKSFIMLPEKHRKMRRNGTFAAVLLVLIGLSSVIWQNHEKNRNSYDDYFKAPKAVSSFRSGGEINAEDLNKGFELYNKTEYLSAKQYFDRVLQTDDVNPVAHYWAGLANQQIQHYPEALHHFQKVIIHGDNLFIEQAEWFSVLCKMKISGKLSIGSQLEAVINRKGHYYKDALNLRSKLLKGD